MCLDLLYRNSESEYCLNFSYLAVKDKILVNKVFEDDEEINGINYGGDYDNYLWLRFEDSKGSPVVTALINYYDIDCNWEDKESFWKTLQGQLTSLNNDGFSSELVSNCTEMFHDACLVQGFNGTYIGELIDKDIQKAKKVFIRTVDFGMHLPSELEIHPFYDT